MKIKIMRVKVMLTIAFAFVTLIMMTGCDQFPIFYTVSKEIAPKKPKIPGSPTKIVGDNNALYVSNGKIWHARGANWTWEELPQQPSGGAVRDIAYADKLYALTIDNKTSRTTVWQYESSKWTSLHNGSNLQYQALHSDGANLYIVSWNGTNSDDYRDYAVLDKSGNILIPQIHFVRGVVGDWYATLGGGIWNRTSNITLASGKSITGIINTTVSGIVAVSSDGYVYLFNSNSTGDVISSASYDYSFTGALAVWENQNSQPLLLIGTQVSSVQFGYREARLQTGSIGTLESPGNITPSSVGGDTESYAATIESRAIVSVMQAPDTTTAELPLIFASTQSDGLWSYRRDSSLGKPAWNRED